MKAIVLKALAVCLLGLFILPHASADGASVNPYFLRLLNIRPSRDLLSNVVDGNKLARWIEVHLDPLPNVKAISPSEYTGIHYETMNYVLKAILLLNLFGNQPSHAREIASIVQSYQLEDGGFGLEHPKAHNPSTIDGTFLAVMMLDALGARPLDVEAAARFLRSKQVLNGGFYTPEYGNASKHFEETDLQNTARAVLALRVLGSWPFDTHAAIDYVRAYEVPYGPASGLFSVEVAASVEYFSDSNQTELRTYFEHFFPQVYVAETTFNGLLTLKAMGVSVGDSNSAVVNLRSFLEWKHPLWTNADIYFLVLALASLGYAPSNPEEIRDLALRSIPENFNDLSFENYIEPLYRQIMILGALANTAPQCLYRIPLPSDISVAFIGAALLAGTIGVVVDQIRRKRH